MPLFFRKSKSAIAAPVTQPHRGRPFDLMPPSFSPYAGSRLYYMLRQAVPLIDAAVMKTVRLTGGFDVRCADPAAQSYLDRVLRDVPVGGNRQGIAAFTEGYLEQLLTCGTALAEIVTDTSGSPAGLWISPLEGIELRRAENGFDIDIYVTSGGTAERVKNRENCLLSVLSPSPGAIEGNSMLKGLPFVSDILLRIYESIGSLWERAGNLRFAVTYNPGKDSFDKSLAAERAKVIAREWQNAMRNGDEIRDFVCAGDVSIRVIGAEGGIPDSAVAVRQLLEQIVAKTGLPPFLLGLSWSTTERMSAQQADMLTSELESYRRILTPVIERICRAFLRDAGYTAEPSVEWHDISLQDEVEQSRAKLLSAQADKIMNTEN